MTDEERGRPAQQGTGRPQGKDGAKPCSHRQASRWALLAGVCSGLSVVGYISTRFPMNGQQKLRRSQDASRERGHVLFTVHPQPVQDTGAGRGSCLGVLWLPLQQISQPKCLHTHKRVLLQPWRSEGDVGLAVRWAGRRPSLPRASCGAQGHESTFHLWSGPQGSLTWNSNGLSSSAIFRSNAYSYECFGQFSVLGVLHGSLGDSGDVFGCHNGERG